jgi:predicted porin
MKKTLIALAAVAVSTAAMAQVTVSGKLRFAYESTKEKSEAGVTVKANGLRVTDGDVRFTAVDDLGNGMKATAMAEFTNRGRENNPAARDASISLAGGFGTVMIGAVEAGNGIIGLGGAGAPVYGQDGFAATCVGGTSNAECGALDGGTNVNILSYTSPAFSGITFTANMTDAASGSAGMEKTATTTDGKTVGVRYSAGPLAAALDTTRNSQNAAADTATKSRVRLSASYDLGVAKLGFGYQTRKYFDSDADTNKQTIVGVSVPMGAITLGMNYATQKEGDAKITGTDIGAKYDLSKRTYVAAHYTSNKATDTNADGKFNKFRLQVAHSF